MSCDLVTDGAVICTIQMGSSASRYRSIWGKFAKFRKCTKYRKFYNRAKGCEAAHHFIMRPKAVRNAAEGGKEAHNCVEMPISGI